MSVLFPEFLRSNDLEYALSELFLSIELLSILVFKNNDSHERCKNQIEHNNEKICSQFSDMVC